jgi:hypothetical protein
MSPPEKPVATTHSSVIPPNSTRITGALGLNLALYFHVWSKL